GLFPSSQGRFDLYLLFFERALELLKPEGRLVFITPEKFLYVQAAQALRRALARHTVEEIHLVDELTFGKLVTYPTITTVVNSSPRTLTSVILRNGTKRKVNLSEPAWSWLPLINGSATERSEVTLADVCVRVSCGVATGADS